MKDKARQESDKIQEIQFINYLEQTNKKLTLDDKLQVVVERKKILKDQFRQKQLKNQEKESQVVRRKMD